MLPGGQGSKGQDVAAGRSACRLLVTLGAFSGAQAGLAGMG